MLSSVKWAASSLLLATLFAGCGHSASKEESSENIGTTKAKGAPSAIILDARQIEAAGISVVRPSVGGSAGAIELPATIEADPQGIQIVSAAIGGRVVTLDHNLGDHVSRGDALAVIESREAAQLNGAVEATRARSALAQSQLRREQRLFAERVSPEQDLIAARTAATEARIAQRQAQQQLSAAGGGGGSLNRLALRSPISGQIIARSVTPGQTVAGDAELYRVANLSTLSLAMSLAAADAGLVHTGATIAVTAPGRQGTARVTFVSPVLDARTRLVPVIASIDNAAGRWRVGESIQAAISLPDKAGLQAIGVPQTAVQTIDGKSVVFVRSAKGFRVVPVTLGASSGDRVVILSGLTGAEEVAATNSFTLKAELGKSAAGEEE